MLFYVFFRDILLAFHSILFCFNFFVLFCLILWHSNVIHFDTRASFSYLLFHFCLINFYENPFGDLVLQFLTSGFPK